MNISLSGVELSQMNSIKGEGGRVELLAQTLNKLIDELSYILNNLDTDNLNMNEINSFLDDRINNMLTSGKEKSSGIKLYYETGGNRYTVGELYSQEDTSVAPPNNPRNVCLSTYNSIGTDINGKDITFALKLEGNGNVSLEALNCTGDATASGGVFIRGERTVTITAGTNTFEFSGSGIYLNNKKITV